MDSSATTKLRADILRLKAGTLLLKCRILWQNFKIFFYS